MTRISTPFTWWLTGLPGGWLSGQSSQIWMWHPWNQRAKVADKRERKENRIMALQPIRSWVKKLRKLAPIKREEATFRPFFVQFNFFWNKKNSPGNGTFKQFSPTENCCKNVMPNDRLVLCFRSFVAPKKSLDNFPPSHALIFSSDLLFWTWLRVARFLSTQQKFLNYLPSGNSALHLPSPLCWPVKRGF